MANKKILTNLTVQGDTQSDSFVKDNGLSSEFLKADGSVDSTVYAPESHDHLRILATDDRDVKPNATSVGSTIRGIQPFFTSLGGMTGSANTNYQDLLVFDTYQDSSGGFANAMTLDKSDGSMRIWNAASFATSWGTPKRVWTDDDFSSVPTYTAGDGLLLDGTEFKVNGDSLAGSIDLDTMRTTGTFPQNSNANATSGSNYPEDLAGMLEVINDDFGNGLLTIQRYTMYNTSRVWSRRYYNGTWSTWVDMTLNSTYNLSGYLLNTSDELTGTLDVRSAGAIANVPSAGDAPTGFSVSDRGIYGTMFGSKSNGRGYIQQQRFDGTATAYALDIQPNGGDVLFGGDILADNLSGTNTGDQDLSGYLTNTTDTLTGILTIDGQALISNTFPTLDFVDTNSFTDTADRFRVRAGINSGQIQWYDDSTSTTIEMMSFGSTGYVSIGDVAQNGYQATIASLGAGSVFAYGKIFTLGALQAAGTVTGSNLSGTNTGDQDLSSYLTSLSGAVLTTTNQNIGGNKTFDDLVHINTDDDSGYQLTVGVANSLYSIFALGRIYSQAEIGASTMSVINDITAGGFKTNSGTSSQFLKADGSVDSSDYLLNTTDTFTGVLTTTGSILAKGQITNSSAALQVNGFQRTGNIYLHSGGNSPNTASTNVVLSNVLGKLVIDQDVSADNLSGTNTGDQDLSGYLLNTSDTLDGSLNVTSNFTLGDGGNGQFFSDTDGRTAFRNGDFYIQASVTNSYNYATNQYIGNASGDNIYFRSNPLTGTNWGIDTSAKVSAKKFYIGAATASTEWAFQARNSASTADSGLYFNSGSAELLLRDASNNLNTRIKGSGTSYFLSNVAIGSTTATSGVGATRMLRIASTGNSEVNVDHTDGGASSDLGLFSFSRAGDHLAHMKSSHDGSTTSAFISFHTQATSGAFANAAANERMRISSTGDVGIGTNNPGYKLDVSGDGRFTSTVTATNFILSSDSRLKDNVEEVDNKHIDVNWKTFEMKSEKGQSRYGVIAQELEEVHPEFVRTDDEGMKSVAYVDLLIAKNAELEARLEKLERLLLDK